MNHQQPTESELKAANFNLRTSLSTLRQHPAVNFAGRLALAYTASVVLTLAVVGAASVIEADKAMKAELEEGEPQSEEDALVAEYIQSLD